MKEVTDLAAAFTDIKKAAKVLKVCGSPTCSKVDQKSESTQELGLVHEVLVHVAAREDVYGIAGCCCICARVAAVVVELVMPLSTVCSAVQCHDQHGSAVVSHFCCCHCRCEQCTDALLLTKHTPASK
eukprot:19001-Heterococcus_DN1.PRE.1